MKKKIIDFNKQFGLTTDFFTDKDVEGYALGSTIYLNENSQDLEKVNKHELLHFFENDEAFKRIKEIVLRINEERIKEIREEYKLRYFGLYSEEEIEKGILDTEIVIDFLVDNSTITYDQVLKIEFNGISDFVLSEIITSLEQKRYLTLSIKTQIENMNISKWDKIFVANFYDGKKHIFPSKEGRQERIKEDIKAELERLYNLSEEEFRISPDSNDILREYESELNALEARGKDISIYQDRKSNILEELAERYSKQLYEEYKHIVDLIKGASYEDSFKALMLNETLAKTYKLDTSDGKKTIVKKRKMHETIASHMALNEIVLDTIYKNVNDYDNFANLYFAGLEIFNQTIAKKNNITLEGVDTYGMGHWIKFAGKTSDEQNYIKNAQELSSLVKDTPWCTKNLASSQLAQGDFYVFVDNENKPHIAVKMNGEEIDELRGILHGNAQELEEDYRKVAISFLEKNKAIKNGAKWLRKEEWNKRLIKHIQDIENGNFKDENLEQLIDDCFGNYEYKAHFSSNTNKEKLKELLPKIKKNIVKHYNCKENEIAVGDINFYDENHNTLKTCPYKIIFGDADFGNSQIHSLGNLTTIVGNAYFIDSKVQDFGDLTTIGGNAYFSGSQIHSLGNLTTIVGNAHFSGSQIKDLGNLTTIEGDADFSDSEVQDLGNLTTIGGNAHFSGSKVQSLGNLTSIVGKADFSDSQIKDLGSLITIEGDTIFSKSQVQSLGNLTIIKGNAEFSDSQVQFLGNLTTIEGDAVFSNSEVQDLGNLTTIGGEAYFSNSQIRFLGNLTTIEGNVYFNNSKVGDLGNLTRIGGSVFFRGSQVQFLRNLTTIEGDADFSDSEVQNLGNLTTIGGYASFSDCQVQSLGSLEVIGGFADFSDSQVRDLGNLTRIEGDADFRGCQIEDFGNLEYIGGRFKTNNRLLEDLYYDEFDETGHRKQMSSSMKR